MYEGEVLPKKVTHALKGIRRIELKRDQVLELKSAANQAKMQIDEEAVLQELIVDKGTLPNLVIDTTGEAETMRMSLGLVSYRGSLVFTGYFMGKVMVPSALLYARELSVTGAGHPESEDYKEAIRLVEEEEINYSQLKALASHTCDLDEFPTAARDWCLPENSFSFGLVRVGDV